MNMYSKFSKISVCILNCIKSKTIKTAKRIDTYQYSKLFQREIQLWTMKCTEYTWH